MIKTNYEEKYAIMEQYRRIIGKEIEAKTKYKGYPIGMWQTNIRALDRHGKLCLPETLRQGFTQIGVIAPRKRKEKVSTLHKYEAVIEFKRKFPDKSINGKTINEKGEPIGIYRNDLQIAYSTGKLRLSKEQISELKKARVFNKSNEEVEALAKKYNISAKQVRKIENSYGDTEEFITRYKSGDISLSIDEMNELGIKDFNIVALSSRSLNVNEKSAIIKFILNIQGIETNQRLDNKGKFVDIDYLDELISSLSPQDRTILELIYGLNGKQIHSKRAVSRELHIGADYINARIKYINLFFRHKYPAMQNVDTLEEDQIEHLIKSNEEKDAAIEELENLSFYDEIVLRNEYNRLTRKFYNGINDGTKVSSCTYLSTRAINALIKKGISTIGQARQLTIEEAAKLVNVGEKTFLELVAKLELKLKTQITILQELLEKLESKKQELQDKVDRITDQQSKIRYRLDNINAILEEYNLAYADYMKTNIFDGDEQVQATGTSHIHFFDVEEEDKEDDIQTKKIHSKTTLKQKKEQKDRKNREYSCLQKALEEQLDKQKMLEEILVENGITFFKEKGE